MSHRVYAEAGAKRVFVVSLEWPGWCRGGRSLEDALEHFAHYAPRYADAVGVDVGDDDIEIIGEVPGDATTDFGAPRVQGPWDEMPLPDDVRRAHVDVLRRCWEFLDEVMARAPRELAKGPRGGGRDRDQVVEHVREAERRWCAKAGLRLAPRTPWVLQRAQLTRRLDEGYVAQAWPADFALRIIAWHILDHAWEIEDKSS